MTRKDLWKSLIVEGQERQLPQLWRRVLQLPLDSGKIITLVGVRRSGKTYHLFNLMKRLREAGVASQRVLYINFEDERLQLKSSELDLILQAYQEIYPDIKLSDCYFFFDEIQEVEGWEAFIARLYASVSKHIFITGSNANLLSREIATALRGRTITFEVYPLSFHELTNIKQPDINVISSRDRANAAHWFEVFMHQGGFPEIVMAEESLKEIILQGYFNVMVLRDLIERYRINQVAILKYFCKRIIGNSASEFSVNKIYNELKSQGYHVSKDTLYEYQDYTETIYLNRLVPKYSPSVVKSAGSQKKTYVIDQGFGSALDYKLSQDKGRRLENTVALELCKRGEQIFYYKDNLECDFITVKKDKPIAAIQVTHDFSEPSTKKREIKGLIQCCNSLGLKEGTILTFDHKEEIETDNIKINILPTWEYLLKLEFQL